MTKILLFTVQYPPHIGGVPAFYYNITRMLPNSQISVLTAKEKGWQETDKSLRFPIHRIRILNRYRYIGKIYAAVCDLVIFPYLIWVALKEKSDVIILGHSNLSFLTMCYILKKLLNKKYVIFAHGDGDSPVIKRKSDFLKRYFYGEASLVIANSNFTKDRLIQKFQVPPQAIFVLHPGVDTNEFHPFDSSTFRKDLDLDGKKVILTAGRLDKRKGHDMILKALPRIMAEIPDLVYLIVGSGAYKSELEKISHDLKLNDHVKFIGRATDEQLKKFYNACDLFVMPNRELEDGDTEGFGMVFIEANACGKPVIGGRSGGAVEAIVDGTTGFLVNPSDLNDISSKIIHLLKNDVVAKQMGEEGRKRATGEFDWQVGVGPKLNILYKILSGEKKQWAY